MKLHITTLPGDGIGQEVTAAAVKVMHHVAQQYGVTISIAEKPIGGVSYDEFGTPLTDDTLQACYDSQAVLLGAVGGYKWESLPHHLKPEAALLKLRKSLGLFANIRPALIYPALLEASSLKRSVLEGTNFVVIRELTGGIYFGEPSGHDEEKGFSTMVYTREEVERIARKAFEVARLRNKRVTSVDKANVLEVSQFWRNVVHEVHRDYQDVELNDMYVDNAAMQIVRDPKQFDVIVTGNMFGDILSDVAGMITGSLGMLPSASLGTKYAMYEPVHGSAPDIAGQNRANPIATIDSVAMLFKYTAGLTDASHYIVQAIQETLGQGYRTADIANDESAKVVTTTEMTDIIVENFQKVYQEGGVQEMQG